MTFKKATEVFVAKADWLTEIDQPAVESLRAAARKLDGDDFTPALLSSYNLTYRNLLRRAPNAAGEPTDPLAKALADAEAEQSE